ncbi:SRPBCC family protein [Actinocrispum sp. NPDC049592]|uniref:SRPBCC family protein n=1 Tax=Actinocrispum sp. NPDC049592 TaxID=3154835 RepID=UPI0034153376
MQLEHKFTVNAPVDDVWQALLDPERVAPCMPGATLTSVDGPKFAGTVKVKMGPISLQYKGSGEFVSTDQDTRVLKINASGKDSRGNGTASADVTVTLSTSDGTTVGDVVTELAVTGKPAQFGRGLIAEVGGKILDTFAQNLAAQLEPEQDSPSAADDAPATEEPAEEPVAKAPHVVPVSSAPEIDLLEYAGSSVVKRVAPLIILGLLLVIFLSRRKRK